jgi:ankyrin repeat protein
LLLSAGADPNVRDSETGLNSLYHSVNTLHDSVSLLLLQHGADFMTPDREGNTVLHLASQKCDTLVIRYLIDHGANIDASNNEGKRPSEVAGCANARLMLTR